MLNFGIPQGPAGQNGADGQDGADGADGVSPTVAIGTITGGHSVTITDADHPTGQSFNVMDGEDGVGVPSGGTTGQVLKKASGTDYDTEWGTASSGGHTILNSSGTTMTQRTNLQFTSKVADDSGNDKTIVYSGSEENITIGHTTGSSGTGKWITENNTIDGAVYPYRYSATLTKAIYGMPKIEYVATKGSGSSSAKAMAFNCIAYVGHDVDYPTTLKLYATAVPTVDFNILVKWEGGEI